MKLPVSILALVLSIIVCNSSMAQPLGRTHRSVESLVASSEFVAIGRIKRAKENIIVPPGPISSPDARGEIEYEIETQFDEILKNVNLARESSEFEIFRTLDPRAGKNEQLAKWVEDETVGLWLIEPQHESENFRRWEFIPFDERGVNYFGYRSVSIKPPMFTRDLSVLTTSEQILQRIREYSPVSQAEQAANTPAYPIVGAIIPGEVLGEIKPSDYERIVLPYDSMLPNTARSLIESPRDFVSKADVEQRPDVLDELRLAGIELLGQIKTDTSIELLQRCLDESILPFEPSRQAARIRTEAYQHLLAWKVNPPRPKFSDQINVLNLGNEGITDDTLALISEHKNLVSLNLNGADISSVGVEHLAVLKRLRELALDDLVFTNEMAQTLRANDQLHLISRATIEGSNKRPNSVDEVTSLKLWGAPLTDTGLREFSCFKNLTSLELGRVNITDQAIEQLVQFRELKSIRLRETQVSEAGITALQKSLPNCRTEVFEMY